MITKIDIAGIDHSLLTDIENDVAGWELYEAEYEDATVSNQGWQIVFNPASERAGIVFVGSGSSGLTIWTDASSPEDAMRRMREDEISN